MTFSASDPSDRRRVGKRNARAQVGLAHALRDIRKMRGLSIGDVARDTGLTEDQIRFFETGGMNFAAATLRRYAKAVGADLDLTARPHTPDRD